MSSHTLLTEEKLRLLPQRALIALAGRCAQHVKFLIDPWIGEITPYLDDINQAIELTIAYATNTFADSFSAYTLHIKVNSAVRAAIQGQTNAEQSEEYEYAMDACRASFAIEATEAALCAVAVACNEPEASRLPGDVQHWIMQAIDCAVMALDSNMSCPEVHPQFQTVIKAIQKDYENLSASAKRQGWENSTPIPIDFFSMVSDV